jgi:class 3 adenylate cyclase/tetratricopeptide (TPR) repeat protein
VNCPVCGHSNDPGSRFCSECGTELTITCPTCGTVSALDAKFCNSCGTDLRSETAGTDDPTARFVPPEMLAKLRSARSGQAMRGERRTVTMLFADVQGSTAAAEQLDPEDWADVMNGAFEQLITPIYRYEGTLARLLGDAILAFFGAPIAHEDDPIRAIRAGLEIVEAMDAYCATVRAEYGIPIQVRVGVNTGLVVVGEVGSDLRVEYTALGDAINVAARMEQTATPGTVQVTGKSEPMRTFRPVRFVGRSTDGRAATLVGREEELALLDELGTRLDGTGWIASIVGEAGLGKSAILREWERRLGLRTTLARSFDETGDVALLFGASQSYDVATPFAGIREVLGPWFGLDGTDDFERIRRACEDVEFDDAPAFLAYVTGVDVPSEVDVFLGALDPPVLRSRSTAAISAYLAAEAARRPVIVVCEDLHWADDLSVDIVTELLDLPDRAPVGVMVVMRPYRDDPSWRVHERADRDHHHRYHHVLVDPMPADDSAALLDELLASGAIDDADRQHILTRAEGNPLFLEEIARALAEGEGIDGVPTSLSGILTARLDRLDEQAHLVAQVSSVFGTEFRRSELTALVDGEGLDRSISDLLRSGILMESPAARDGLRFRHALIQEAAYESILLKTRRRLHGEVAAFIQASRSDDVENISRHLVAAEDFEAAFPYLVETGSRATRAMSLADAIRQFRLAIDHTPEDADPELIQQAHIGLGEAYALLPDLSESAAAFQRLFEYGEQNERPTAQVAALNQLAFTTAVYAGDTTTASTYLTEARRLAEEAGDERGLADYHMNACMVAAYSGDPITAVTHDQATIELGGTLGDDRIRIEGLVRRAMNQTVMLDLANAESSIELAVAAAGSPGLERQLSELQVLGTGFLSLAKGDYARAAEIVEENLPILERYASFDSAMGYRLLGFAKHQLGDLEGALTAMAAARGIAQTTGQSFVAGTASAGLAAIYATVGRFDEFPSLREEALAMSEGPLADLYASTAWADIGTAELLRGDPGAAEDAFSRGLAASSLTQYLERTRLLGGLALSLVSQGDLERAETLLAEAREFAADRAFHGSDALLAYVEGELHRAAGRPSDAAQALTRAVETARAHGQRLVMAAAAQALALVADDPGEYDELARRTVAEIGRSIIDEEIRTSFLQRWSEPVALASG